MNRLVPVLLVKDRALVKTVRFKNPNYIGDPINAVRIFNDKEVDELIVLDITKKAKGFEPDYEFIERISSEAFIPITYGGGISSLKQAEKLFRAGIEKLSIQTAALKNPKLIQELAKEFGSQSIVFSIDLVKGLFRKYDIYDYNWLIRFKTDFLFLIKKMVDLGAGEIFVNCVHKDGTLEGPDLEAIELVVNSIETPMIYCGGIRNLEDVRKCSRLGVSGIAAGSFFVYHGARRAVLITYPKYADIQNAFCDKY